MKKIMTEKEYVEWYKKQNPIYTTSGSGTGTFKWIKYLDGIDLRYGHDTRRQAVYAIRKSAKMAYAQYVWNETETPCPNCKTVVKNRLQFEGRCVNCFEKDMIDN